MGRHTQGLESVQDAFKQPQVPASLTWKQWKHWKLCLECFNSRETGTLYRRTQGSSLTGFFYLKSETGMAKEAVAGN